MSTRLLSCDMDFLNMLTIHTLKLDKLARIISNTVSNTKKLNECLTIFFQKNQMLLLPSKKVNGRFVGLTVAISSKISGEFVKKVENSQKNKMFPVTLNYSYLLKTSSALNRKNKGQK